MQPFDFRLDEMADCMKEELIDLQHNAALKHKFTNISVSDFWVQCLEGYPLLAKRALEQLVPFATTYLCERAFSSMVAIKSKYRNKLDIKSDMRVALSSTSPRFDELISNRRNYEPNAS